MKTNRRYHLTIGFGWYTIKSRNEEKGSKTIAFATNNSQSRSLQTI